MEYKGYVLGYRIFVNHFFYDIEKGKLPMSNILTDYSKYVRCGKPIRNYELIATDDGLLKTRFEIDGALKIVKDISDDEALIDKVMSSATNYLRDFKQKLKEMENVDIGTTKF